MAASWVSAVLFAAYILAFFGGGVLNGAGQRWSEALPGLYTAGLPISTIPIGGHFIAGGMLLLLGPIQLIGAVRRALPGLHRWLGRIYVISAGMAGFSGLAFIVRQGTFGGPLMDVGFGLYGALTLQCAVMTLPRPVRPS